MKKFLFCGDVNSQWNLLIDRVNKLQSSSHGPFDALFCVGKFFVDENECNNISSAIEFPLNTFVLDRTGYCEDCGCLGDGRDAPRRPVLWPRNTYPARDRPPNHVRT